MIPHSHWPFFQPERSSHDRDGGLQRLLQTTLALDGRIDSIGAMLDPISYDLTDDDGYLSVYVTLRLSWWSKDQIDNVVEQSLGLLSLVPNFGRPYPSALVALDRAPDEVIDHVTSLLNDRQATAQARISVAPRTCTPADLFF